VDKNLDLTSAFRNVKGFSPRTRRNLETHHLSRDLLQRKNLIRNRKTRTGQDNWPTLKTKHLSGPAPIFEALIFLKPRKVLGNDWAQSIFFFLPNPEKKFYWQWIEHMSRELARRKVVSPKLFFARLTFFFEKKMTGPESLCFASTVF